MPRRYQPRTGTYRSAEALQTELLSSLRREGESLLRQLTEQFTNNLQALQNQVLQNLSSGSDGASLPGNNYNRLITTAGTYIFNRPGSHSLARETSRSIDANIAFRISRAQQAVEASQAIAQGDKNR